MLGTFVFLKTRRAVWSGSRNPVVQGGVRGAALLLPTSDVRSRQVNRYAHTGGLQTTACLRLL